MGSRSGIAYNIVMVFLTFFVAAAVFVVMQLFVNDIKQFFTTMFPASYYSASVTGFFTALIEYLPVIVLLSLAVYAYVTGQKRNLDEDY